MTATATTDKQESPDLDALAHDTQARLEELHEQWGRLSLDALTDEPAASELAAVQSEIASAERLLEQARLAGDERERRKQEAQRAAEEKRRAEAQRRAERLEGELRKTARAVDQGAVMFGNAVVGYLAAQDELVSAQRQAGTQRQPDHLLGSSLESALVHGLASAGVPHRLLDIGGPITGVSRPLAPEEK